MTAKKETITFETQLQQLEQLVEQLERGDLPLESSLQAFEQGIKLSRQCYDKLNKAEQKVQVLIEKNGLDKLEEFQPE